MTSQSEVTRKGPDQSDQISSSKTVSTTNGEELDTIQESNVNFSDEDEPIARKESVTYQGIEMSPV